MRLFFLFNASQSHHLLGFCGFTACRWQCCEEYCCQHVFVDSWWFLVDSVQSLPASTLRGSLMQSEEKTSEKFQTPVMFVFVAFQLSSSRNRWGGKTEPVWTPFQLQRKYLKQKKLAVLREQWSLGKGYLLSTAEQTENPVFFTSLNRPESNARCDTRCDTGCSSTSAPHSLDKAVFTREMWQKWCNTD